MAKSPLYAIWLINVELLTEQCRKRMVIARNEVTMIGGPREAVRLALIDKIIDDLAVLDSNLDEVSEKPNDHN